MTDSVEDILNEMDGDIALIRGAMAQAEGSLIQVQQSCHDLLDAMYEPHNAVWSQWGAVHDLRIPATGRTQEVEWVLSFQYAKQKLQSSFRPQPICDSQGGITFSLTPVGTVGIAWASTSGERIPAARIELRFRWRVVTSVTAESEDVTHVIQLIPVLRGADVRFIECTVSEFYDDQGVRKDVFWMLPSQHRRQCREQLFQKANELVSAQLFPIPPLNVLGTHPLPHSVTLWANQLHAAGWSRQKRRGYLDLAGSLDASKNAGARIKKDIVMPIIKKQIEAQEVKMHRIDFYFGYIETEVSKHWQKTTDIIVGTFTVRIDVTLVYKNIIMEMRPAVLYDNATQCSYKITVTSPDCGPPCDGLRDILMSKAMDDVKSSENLTFEFVDLSAICQSATCSIQPYGLYFLLHIQ